MRFRPRVEWLEDRRLLAIFTVLNTNDSGPASLRQAILDANLTTQPDAIQFSIPGPGVHTINLASALPDIVQPVVLDGSSQLGMADRPLIELNGALAGASADGLRITASASTVRGLIINGFGGAGVFLGGDNNVLVNSFIGTDRTGQVALGNQAGVVIQGADNRVGGALGSGGLNVIAGNQGPGILVVGPAASNNQILGNFIGTDRTGTRALGNFGPGVRIASALDNLVGGFVFEERNLIAGNQGAGVEITDPLLSGASGNLVLNNYLGTDIFGTAPLANGSGVRVVGSAGADLAGTLIGVPGAGNLIAGNTGPGVELLDVQFVTVQGNRIGTAVDGLRPLGNGGAGVRIGGTGPGSRFNTIGGLAGDTGFGGNTIAHNAGAGVVVLPHPGQNTFGNSIIGNALFSNGGLGIDLGGDGVTANDLGDADNGPNELQNFPVLTSAVTVNGTTLIQGVLQSAPQGEYAIDLFASPAADPSGFGEGQRYLTTLSVVTDQAGTASILETLPFALPLGWTVTATATDFAGSTSEFSSAVAVTAGGSPQVFVVTSTGNTGPGSLRQAIVNANSNPGLDTILFNIPVADPNFNALNGVFTIQLAAALPDISDAVILDGRTQPTFIPGGPPVIRLDGAAAGAGVSGLTVTGGNSTIRGLIVTNFRGDGIALHQGGGNRIEGNWIGLGLTSAGLPLAQGNQGNGIFVDDVAANTLGSTVAGNGNVIAANGGNGILLLGPGARGNQILGNFIGTDPTGLFTDPDGVASSGDELGNRLDGIALLDAPGNTIGSSLAGGRNVVAGNLENGVAILGTVATGNSVQGNFIGTDRSGTLALANRAAGVRLLAPGNLIGGVSAGTGNVIAGNGRVGIQIVGQESFNNLVQGNFIGTDVTGNAALPNGTSTGMLEPFTQGGIFVNAPFNLIGGAVPGAGNLVSGNEGFGIGILGDIGNAVQGNRIGTDASGTLALGNNDPEGPSAGVLVRGAATLVGGLTPQAGNLIAGQAGVGLQIDSFASHTWVWGNTIGTDAAGLAPLPNGQGVAISASGNFLGGALPGQGNVISGNKFEGVALVGTATGGDFNMVQGNRIGTQADGLSPLPNGKYGLLLDTDGTGGPRYNFIGGIAPGEGNVIALNVGAGIAALAGQFNFFPGNAIFLNGGLGIDLGGDGVTANDADDADAGANGLQNFPDLASALYDTGTGLATITGTYTTYLDLPASHFLLAFYASALPDSSGFGEGELFLGSILVSLAGTSTTSFMATLPTPDIIGRSITATASPAYFPAAGTGTSEFSGAITANNAQPPEADLIVTKDDGQLSAVPGTPISYTITVTNKGPATVASLTLLDSLPPELLNPVFSPSTGSYDPLTGQWIGLALAAGQSVTLTLTALIDPAATGSLVNTVTVFPPAGLPDPVPSDNVAGDITNLTPQADLAISKDDGAGASLPGAPITYTITVTNRGPSTVGSVTVQDMLPPALLSPAFTPSTGVYDPLTGQWTGLTLAAGQSIILTLTGVIDPAATGALVNTVLVAPPNGVADPNPANNLARDTNLLRIPVDLAVTKTDGLTEVVPGSPVNYTITVTNLSPNPVSSLTLVDVLPAALLLPTFTPSVGVYDPLSGLWTGFTIGLNQSITLTLSGLVDSAALGGLINTVTVSPPAGTADTDPTNNTATDIDALTPQINLAVTKTDSPDPIPVDYPLTYVVTVTNTGLSTATGVVLTDTLPAGVDLVSASHAFTQSGAILTFAIGTLAPGASAAIQIVVIPRQQGTITNSAQAAGNEPETVLSDNQAAESTTVTPPNLQIVVGTGAIDENDFVTLTGTVSLVGPPVVVGSGTPEVTIDWGDGAPLQTVTPTDLGGGQLAFAVPHQYLNNLPGNAPYPVQVFFTDHVGYMGAAATTLDVRNVAPQITVLSTVEIVLQVGDVIHLNGAFTDPGSLDGHTVQIGWGDGSPPTILVLPPGVLTFSATHLYLTIPSSSRLAGVHPITVTVVDSDGDQDGAGVQLRVPRRVPPPPPPPPPPGGGTVPVPTDDADNPSFLSRFLAIPGGRAFGSSGDALEDRAPEIIALFELDRRVRIPFVYESFTPDERPGLRGEDFIVSPFDDKAAGAISGAVFEDIDGNGVHDGSEKQLANQVVYLDINNNGRHDAAEPTALTNDKGEYRFLHLKPGVYYVRHMPDLLSTPTYPDRGEHVITLANDEIASEVKFGSVQIRRRKRTPRPSTGMNVRPLPAQALAEKAGIDLFGSWQGRWDAFDALFQNLSRSDPADLPTIVAARSEKPAASQAPELAGDDVIGPWRAFLLGSTALALGVQCLRSEKPAARPVRGQKR